MPLMPASGTSVISLHCGIWSLSTRRFPAAATTDLLAPDILDNWRRAVPAGTHGLRSDVSNPRRFGLTTEGCSTWLHSWTGLLEASNFYETEYWPAGLAQRATSRMRSGWLIGGDGGSSPKGWRKAEQGDLQPSNRSLRQVKGRGHPQAKWLKHQQICALWRVPTPSWASRHWRASPETAHQTPRACRLSACCSTEAGARPRSRTRARTATSFTS